MHPTPYIGVVAAALFAILAQRERTKWIWWFCAVCQLFGATSVATILGGSSLTVPFVGFLALMVAAVLTVALQDQEALRRTLSVHGVAIAIMIYAMVVSAFAPRIFAGQIDLITPRPTTLNGVAIATPLQPSMGNMIHASYLCLSFVAAMVASLVFTRKLPAAEFSRAMLAIGLMHAAFGLIDWVGVSAGQGRLLNFLRNANYSMVDQSIGTVKRLSGTLTEPSSYASVGIPFAVFATELWMRTKSLRAGLIGLFVWTMLLASTSSTGMVCTAAYVLVSVPRGLLAPGNFRAKVIGCGVVFGVILLCVGVSLASPETYKGVRDFILALTVDKGSSDSAIERGTWAIQGWHAFLTSYGLGVGVGSFRSSSAVMAWLGSLGVIGFGLMCVYLAQIARIALKRNANPVQGAAAWGALFAVSTSLLGAATPDPGLIFALLAGFAMHPTLRRVAERQPQAAFQLKRYAAQQSMPTSRAKSVFDRLAPKPLAQLSPEDEPRTPRTS